MFLLAAGLLLGSPLLTEDDALRQIERSPSEEKAVLKAKLAIFYYREQELEKAFKIFLESLQEIEVQNRSDSSQEEQKIYEEALTLYLEHGICLAQETAAQLLSRFEPVLQQQSDYHLLRFFIAAAHANRNEFDRFFDHFFTAYRHYPDHYMAYKTKAILHIKIFERAKTLKEREQQRAIILDHLAKAEERYPADHTLYKVMIAFAQDSDKARLVSDCLNKIIRENIIVPRSELAFYIDQCVLTKQKELAARFIKKASEWYRYSRTIEDAQKYLEMQL